MHIPKDSNLNKEIVNYVNSNAIKRYSKEHKKSMDEAADVFKNLMIYLYIAEKCQEARCELPITESIMEIDNMWHIFLLFTKDYALFSQQYAGKFIHHSPFTDESNVIPETERRANLRKCLNILVSEFGEELMDAWYKDNKYA